MSTCLLLRICEKMYFVAGPTGRWNVECRCQMSKGADEAAGRRMGEEAEDEEKREDFLDF